VSLKSPLPEITSPINIIGDGSIVLDGTDAGFGANGLTISAGKTFISGLSFTNFSGHGILIKSGDSVVLSNNTISDNGGDGVRVLAGKGHSIRANRIFGNAALPIDLGGDGQTPNDFTDADTGVNGLQNAPVLTNAWPGSLSLTGSIRSTPMTAISIDFFASDTCRPLLVPEATTFVGSVDVTTDLSGGAGYTVTFDTDTPIDGYASATATSADGSTSEFSNCVLVGDPPQNVDVEDEPVELPEQFTLYQNYPNPFNPVTRVEFDLPVASIVRLEVFDILGRRIDVLVNDMTSAGHHSYVFNGSRLASGVYFYRMIANEYVSTKQMVLLK